jgi:transposase
MLKPLERAPLTAEEIEALENLYRTTQEVRLRTRAQIILLAGEQRMRARAIAKIVREVDQTVRNWLKGWMAEGIEGLKDRPMPGPPPKISEEYKEH